MTDEMRKINQLISEIENLKKEIKMGNEMLKLFMGCDGNDAKKTGDDFCSDLIAWQKKYVWLDEGEVE